MHEARAAPRHRHRTREGSRPARFRRPPRRPGTPSGLRSQRVAPARWRRCRRTAELRRKPPSDRWRPPSRLLSLSPGAHVSLDGGFKAALVSDRDAAMAVPTGRQRPRKPLHRAKNSSWARSNGLRCGNDGLWITTANRTGGRTASRGATVSRRAMSSVSCCRTSFPTERQPPRPERMCWACSSLPAIPEGRRTNNCSTLRASGARLARGPPVRLQRSARPVAIPIRPSRGGTCQRVQAPGDQTGSVKADGGTIATPPQKGRGIAACGGILACPRLRVKSQACTTRPRLGCRSSRVLML